MPLDGSAFAERVLPLASSVVRAAGATLRLGLVHTPQPVLGGEAGPLPIAETDLRAREREYLDGHGSAVSAAGVGSVSLVHLDGDPGPALEAEIRRGEDDLVIMATHGRGPFSRMWLGSVADYLVRHLETPVLLVRPGTGESSATPPQLPFEHLLIPLDGSELSARIIEPAVHLAMLGRSRPPRITLVTIIEPVLGGGEAGLPFAVPLDPGLLQEQRVIAERRLAEVARRLGDRGLETSTLVVPSPGAGAAIAAEADRVGADLIAMTTHGQRGLRRLVLGSVTDKVVRSSRIPTLVFRPPPELP